MKKIVLPFFALFFLSCTNDKSNKTENPNESSNAHSDNKGINNEVNDGAILGIIKTENYTLKVHRIFSFIEGKSGPNDGYKPKEGNHYLALDVSVKSNIDHPFDMSSIITGARISDEIGNTLEYGSFIKPLGAYTFANPDSKQKDEYSAIQNPEFGANALHRAIVFAFEAPKNAKKFTLSLPISPDEIEKRNEVTISL